MGVVIDLAEQRRARRPDVPLVPAHPVAAVFSFDMGAPFTYLAAERVERLFPHAEWMSVDGEVAGFGPATDADRERAEQRAHLLRLPLVWPERPTGAPARRAAAFAAAEGRAAAWVLAAGRLAYCGGFALDEPDVLAEAAAAAGLSVDACLAAAGDAGHDAALAAGALELSAQGATALPTLAVAGSLVCGEEQLAAAVARAAG